MSGSVLIPTSTSMRIVDTKLCVTRAHLGEKVTKLPSRCLRRM